MSVTAQSSGTAIRRTSYSKALSANVSRRRALSTCPRPTGVGKTAISQCNVYYNVKKKKCQLFAIKN